MLVRRGWWRCSMVAAALVGAACQAIGGALTPGAASPAGSVPAIQGSDASGGNTSSGSTGDRILGTLRVPDSRLIANNSNSLIDLGGAEHFRIMAASQLDQEPLAGALVTLVDADGSVIATASARTDASGSFGIPVRLSKGAFVRASFSAGGKDFAFEASVLPASGDVEVAVDAASTLVVAKIRSLAARGGKILDTMTAESLAAFTRGILANLNSGNIPYMAKGAQDPVPALDQLVLDSPGLEESAALLGQDMAGPSAEWQVSTVVTQETLESMGVLPAGISLSQAGDFEVPEQGVLLVPTLGNPSTPIAIARLGADGQVTLFATLPVGLSNPIRIAAASGSLYVAGIDSAARELRIFGGRGPLTQLASYSTDLTPMQFFDKGRLLVGDDGSILLTGPQGEPITIPAPDRTTQSLVYPTLPPIVLPTSLPEVTPTMAPLPTPMPIPGFGSWASGSTSLDFAHGSDGGLLVSFGETGAIGRIVQGALQPLAGKEGEHGYRSGRGAYSRFESPREIAVDDGGEIFVADVGDHRIRRVSPEGSVFLVAGSGASGVADGPGSRATVNAPRFLRSPLAGTLYFVDTDPASLEERLRKIVKAGH